MIKVDALGFACPTPVIMTKKALRENAEEKDFEILVDNEVATENLTKMAQELHLKSSVEKIEDKKYKVSLERDESYVAEEEEKTEKKALDGSYSVIISSDQMGGGDEDFSHQLLESFVYALTEQDILPTRVVFYNRGVFLPTKNEKVIEDLKKLADRGVEVLSCGLCLGNYGLTDEVQVGTITNMYHIVEIMRSEHVIYPC